MITLILNDKTVSTEVAPGEVTLNFLRIHMGLHGTKAGCREGDCGACTVLIGETTPNGMRYRTAASCMLPIGRLHGRHLVTIEGLTAESKLSPIQQAIIDEGATQCGFCTPGIVVALTGFLLTSPTLSIDDAIAAIEGNICRCTGYTAIRRAVAKLVSSLNLAQDSDLEARHEQLHQTGLLPDIFHNIRQRLQGIPATSVSHSNGAVVAGGTDLFVQHADELANSRINFIPCSCTSPLEIQNNKIVIDASATAEELRNSQIFTNTIPPWHSKLQLLSSTMIRNQATVAGNIVNASPIADLSIIFLALNATLLIKSDDTTRELPLDQFYHDYKIFDLKQTEIIDKLTIPILSQEDHFNFEKVSRREHLDIASVNSAALLHTEAGAITSARISAGGVGPTPMFLKKTSAFLKGREINTATILEATQIAESEISPISDVRGSAGYKRSLLKRLVLAHFIECFPNANLEEAVHELT